MKPQFKLLSAAVCIAITIANPKESFHTPW